MFADGRVEEASDGGSEACVALCESFGCGGVAYRLAPEVDQQQERVAFASERGHEAAGRFERRDAGRELGL